MRSIQPWLLRYLHELDGVSVDVNGDQLRLSFAGGKPVRFRVHAKSRFSVEDARRLSLSSIHNSGEVAFLLVTQRLSDQARSTLAERGVSWIERGTGHCRITGPGLLIDRSASSTEEADAGSTVPDRPATALHGKSGLFAETLLSFYLDSRINVRESASRAGVAIGLASRILQRLDSEGITSTDGEGPQKHRMLSNPAGLLDLWTAEERRDRWLRTGLYVWSRTPRDLYEILRTLMHADMRWAFGGTAAANLYAPTLTTTPPPEVWVPAEISSAQIAEILGGELVDSGANLFVWQANGNEPVHHAKMAETTLIQGRLPLVSRYRAYVEAVGAGGRSSDVAERLREQLNLPSAFTKQ